MTVDIQSTAVTAFVGFFDQGLLNTPILTRTIGEFIAAFGPVTAANETALAVDQFFRNGGAYALIVKAGQENERSPERLVPTDGKTGVYALNDTSFNLLCMPFVATLPEIQSSVVIRELEQYCGKRNAIMLVDVPKEIKTAKEVIRWRNRNPLIQHQNAAIYFPNLTIPDPEDPDKEVTVSPSGTLAGHFAKTDREKGPWHPPGGTKTVLQNILAQTLKITNEETIRLNNLGINCIRYFKSVGHIVWGAGTSIGLEHPNPYWKYVSIRRTLLFIETTLQSASAWTVFEPNNEALWQRLEQMAGKFLQELFNKGAFQSPDPADAYFATCEPDTVPDETHTRVKMTLGLKLLNPDEHMTLRLFFPAGKFQE